MNKEEHNHIISGFIKDVIISEKTTSLQEGILASFGKKDTNKYSHYKMVFKVATDATKTSIKQELKQRFPDNRVISVNTLLYKPKKKRTTGRGKNGYTRAFKKAIVTFENQIDGVTA